MQDIGLSESFWVIGTEQSVSSVGMIAKWSNAGSIVYIDGIYGSHLFVHS